MRPATCVPHWARMASVFPAGAQPIAARLVIAVIVAAVGSRALGQELAQSDADSMQQKLARIAALAEHPRGPDEPPRPTAFSEPEANAYLAHYGSDFLPPGVTDPRLEIGQQGRLTARAIVDLDAVRTSRERSWSDPLAYVTGALEVVATGTVAAEEGIGAASFESAMVAGVAVPKTVLQELVRYYTATPETPPGFDFDQPFELPANIRSIVFDGDGEVTVVQ
jgi:hypothetical protein